MSDSDSDLEEDEETRRLRRRMNKKRRIEGDTLEALGVFDITYVILLITKPTHCSEK